MSANNEQPLRPPLPRWNYRWTLLVFLLVLTLAHNQILSISADLIYLASHRLEMMQGRERLLTLLHLTHWFAPNAASVYNKEGFIYAEVNEQQKSVDAFQQALVLEPGNGAALNNLAEIAYTKGELQRALQLQERAVAVEPNRAAVWYNYGLLWLKQSEVERAQHALSEAIALDPKQEQPYLYLGAIALYKNDTTTAEKRAQQALALNPQSLAAHRLQIDALYQGCHRIEALKVTQRALQLWPKEGSVELRRALILRSVGQWRAALRILESILRSSTDGELRKNAAQTINKIRQQQRNRVERRQMGLAEATLSCQ